MPNDCALTRAVKVMVMLKTGGDASAACEVAAKGASLFPSGVLA